MRLDLEEEEELGGRCGGNSIPGRGNSMVKGPEVRTSLALEKQHGDRGSWGEVSIGEVEGEEKR